MTSWRERTKEQKERNRMAQKRYQYGISAQEYEELLLKQDGKCAVCRNGETRMSRYGRVRSLSVDHCHTTGAIRGLLCDNCNNILGRANDSPAILRRLAAYLEVTEGRKPRFINADMAVEELKGGSKCLPA